MGNPVLALTEFESVTIANGASITAEINTGGRILCGVYMPAAWTAAGLSFQASPDLGVTWYDVHFDGAELTETAAASIFVSLDWLPFCGVTRLKVRSGTSGTPVNQGALRTLLLALGRPAV